jgi:hypothetical protein
LHPGITPSCLAKILKRIKGVIEARRAAGEDLPPAPKTAIAGPEYFGLNDAAVRGGVVVVLGAVEGPPYHRRFQSCILQVISNL